MQDQLDPERRHAERRRQSRRASDRSNNIQSIDSRPFETLRVVHEVARALTSNLDPNALLRAIMAQMEQFFSPGLGADALWSLLLFDPLAPVAEPTLLYALSSRPQSEETRRIRIPLGQGIAGYVAASGHPLVIPDIHSDPDWSRYAEQHPELQLRSIAALPIRHSDRTLGVLQLNNCNFNLLPETAVAFLRVLCDYTAIALENARQAELTHQLSITDDCTGLFNARQLYTALEQEIVRTRAIATNPQVKPIAAPHFSLLFFDLDRFKSVNDIHGHLVGSRLLAEVGNLLKRTLGPQNAAFRYGGDEFVAILPDLDKPFATTLVGQLREVLNESVFLSGADASFQAPLNLKLTASFGLATFPQDGDTLHDLIRSADAMMYAAKASGRDCVSVADSGGVPISAAIHISRHI